MNIVTCTRIDFQLRTDRTWPSINPQSKVKFQLMLWSFYRNGVMNIRTHAVAVIYKLDEHVWLLHVTICVITFMLGRQKLKHRRRGRERILRARCLKTTTGKPFKIERMNFGDTHYASYPRKNVDDDENIWPIQEKKLVFLWNCHSFSKIFFAYSHNKRNVRINAFEEK